MTPEELWASKYARQHAEERAREEARREQAFLDLPYMVAREPLRAMTPTDLLLLNGVSSPFVCPGEADAADVALFFWALHTENDGRDTWRNERAKNRLIRRLAPQPFEDLVAAAREYIEEIFQDAPQGTTGGDDRRPLGTCFLAPLVVSLATETGWSQSEILNTALPRLFQYKKAMKAQALGKDFADFSPSDRITSEFLAELTAARN